MEKRILFNWLIVLVVFGLGVTYAAMHWNFLEVPEAYSDFLEKNLDFQIGLANGMHKEIPDFQSRILVPNIIKTMFIISRRPCRAIFLSELFFAVFSLFSFLLLANKLLSNKSYSLLAVVILSLFTPYCFQLLHRYGELLIVGFYSLLVFFILSERTAWYIFLLFICSLQRPDIAVATVCFRIIYTISIKKKFNLLLFNLLLFLIPVAMLLTITNVYGIHRVGFFNEYIHPMTSKLKCNMRFAKYLFLMYFPIVVATLLSFRYFDKTIKLILISLLPYLLFVTLLGNFSESRLLMPVFSILIIGIVKVIKELKFLEQLRDTRVEDT